MKKLLVFLLLSGSQSVFSQDIENMFKTNPLRINGGVSASSILNYSTNKESNRIPFQYTLSGNVNFSILDWSIPFNYAISNGSSSANYNIPTILAIHPKYKWIQLHLGYNIAMTFSPYTMAGQTFSGAGLELSPKGIFSFKILGGRFIKAVGYDSANINRPFFARYGSAFKIGVKTKVVDFAINSLYAEDDINSLPINPEGQNVLPKRNLATGIEFTTSFSPVVSFNGDVGLSLLNNDIRAPRDDRFSFLGSIVKSNKVTELYKAIKLNTVFTTKAFVFGVGFERIDPNYLAMGALNYNNDYQNINGNLSIPLFKNKVKLAGSVGYQTDNLDEQKENSTGRVVSSGNIQITPSSKFNINASISNFNSLTQVNPYNNSLNNTPYDPDSLRFEISNFNMNLGLNYQIASNSVAVHSINNQTTMTKNTTERGNANLPTTQNLNNNTSYSVALVKAKVNFATGFNVNRMVMDTNKTLNLALMFTASKPFKIKEDNLKTSISFMYNRTNNNSTDKSNVISFRANANYTIFKKHNLTFALGNTFKSKTERTPSTVELIANLNYTYTFSVLEPKSKKKKNESQ